MKINEDSQHLHACVIIKWCDIYAEDIETEMHVLFIGLLYYIWWLLYIQVKYKEMMYCMYHKIHSGVSYKDTTVLWNS